MIYIIGGTAKSGKTYFADLIVKKKGLRVFSSDYLMVALSINQDLKIDMDADDFEVSRNLKPYLVAMTKAMIYNGVNYVLEGVHFQPEIVRELMEKHPEQIKAVFLGYAQADPKRKMSELQAFARKVENAWYNRLNEEELYKLVCDLIDYSKIIKKDCENLSLPYFEISDITKDYEAVMKFLF